MPASTRKIVVEALVLSVVRYCISVYGSCGTTQLKRVQKIINFCARVVSGRKRNEHVSGVIEQLSWMHASELVEYHTVCAMQRAITTGIPADIVQTIGPRAREQHDHDTRHADNLTLPRIHNEAGRRRLCYRGAAMLNDLDVDLSVPSFRVKLKRTILSRRERRE